MGLIPSFVIEKKFRAAAGKLRRGTLDFTMPGGDTLTITGHEPGPRGVFKIRDWDVLRLCAARGDIGLGESYIDGMWDTDDIEALVSLFLLNMDSFDASPMAIFCSAPVS